MAVVLSLVLWISTFFVSGEAPVTITAPSSPPCFGKTYKLTCTHPVLDGETSIRWERNGTGFSTSASTTHQSVETSTTTTTLTITVTREEFENTVYNYRCLTVNTSTDTVVRIYSNNVIVDPLEKPNTPNLNLTGKQYFVMFNDWCFEEYKFQYKVNVCECTQSNGRMDHGNCTAYNKHQGTFALYHQGGLTYAATCTVSIVDTNISSTGETEYFALNLNNEVIQRDECPKNDLKVDASKGDTNDRTTVGVAIGVTMSIIALISVVAIVIFCIYKKQKIKMVVVLPNKVVELRKELQSSTVKDQPQDTSNAEPHFGGSPTCPLTPLTKYDGFVFVSNDKAASSIRFPGKDENEEPSEEERQPTVNQEQFEEDSVRKRGAAPKTNTSRQAPTLGSTDEQGQENATTTNPMFEESLPDDEDIPNESQSPND